MRQQHRQSNKTVESMRRSRPLSLSTTGDLVLREMAAACLTALRPYDVLARYGGEEFVVLLPDVSMPAACEIAERIRQATSAIRVTTGKNETVAVTVSVGISSLYQAEGISKKLLDEADQALYEAKCYGRNRWVCATAQLPLQELALT